MCENSAELKNGKNADDHDSRTETGEDAVGGKGGEIQT